MQSGHVSSGASSGVIREAGRTGSAPGGGLDRNEVCRQPASLPVAPLPVGVSASRLRYPLVSCSKRRRVGESGAEASVRAEPEERACGEGLRKELIERACGESRRCQARSKQQPSRRMWRSTGHVIAMTAAGAGGNQLPSAAVMMWYLSISSSWLSLLAGSSGMQSTGQTC